SSNRWSYSPAGGIRQSLMQISTTARYPTNASKHNNPPQPRSLENKMAALKMTMSHHVSTSSCTSLNDFLSKPRPNQRNPSQQPSPTANAANRKIMHWTFAPPKTSNRLPAVLTSINAATA